MKILVLNGINLNMFGKRDPAQYGTITLDQINQRLVDLGRELGAQVENFQTNFEGALCERIHAAHTDGTQAVLINAGPGRITATVFAMRWLFSSARSLRCTCPIFMRAKRFAIIR